MKRPQLEKVIEKLKEADVKEWEIIRYPAVSYFELKCYGLIFRIERSEDWPELFLGLLTIENYDKNIHILYKRDSYKIKKFCYELSKRIEQSQKKEVIKKLNFLLPKNDTGKYDLEKIITKLKELDTRAWKSDKFFDKKYPVLTTEVSDIIFCISKGLVYGYELEIKYGKELDKKIKFDYTKMDKKRAIKLTGELYEKVYKELKEDKEKEFEERLNRFLSD